MKDREQNVEEIRKVEAAFAARLAEAGMKTAFLEFAAESAVLYRNNRLYKGKAEIEAYLSATTLKDIRLEWEPAHIDVSASGDMAYTYGPYTFSAQDTSGQEITVEGFFHTVWKLQEDGSWKYVWD